MRPMNWRVRGLLMIGMLSLGCQSEVDFNTPPSIRYGEDSCDQCRMIINEARFAAAYVTPQGHVRRFDDIGDMLQFDAARREEVKVFWVHDYETAEWLRAHEAFFVVSPEVQTPMAHGIIAVHQQPRATALADTLQGRVYTFGELRARFRKEGAVAGRAQHHDTSRAPVLGQSTIHTHTKE